MKKHFSIYSIILILFMTSFSCQSSGDQEKKESSIDARVDSLLALMTLEEKVGQTVMYTSTWELTGPAPANGNNAYRAQQIRNGRVGGMLNVIGAKGTRSAQQLAVENSRLGIPLIFGYDVIHGYKTMFPIPLGQAASWNAEVARIGSEISAIEAASSGLHWTFAPMVDICRDGRFGRIMESAGEDPFLTSVMAKAWVNGYQGDDLSDQYSIAACAKHFAGYGFVEAGRDYNTVDISPNTLYNTVLPPFKAASDAGVATFMNAFNDLNGVPATGNAHIQRDILKGEWGFEGFVVSDWGSIGELLNHGFAEDSAHAAQLAMRAGSDMDMESEVYEYHLQKAIEEGKINEKLLDDAVRRILKVKFQLGLFDDPYKYCNEVLEKKNLLTVENLEASRDAARKSTVLLKNEKNLLPLSKDVNSIAVIGELAGSKDVPLGNWRAQANKNSAVSLYEGIKNALGDRTSVEFAAGYQLIEGNRTFFDTLNFAEDDGSGFKEAIRIAKRSEVVIMAIGEDCFQSGEGRSQADITLKGRQLELLEKIAQVNSNIIVVLMNGRPLAIPEVHQIAPAILESWHAGSEAGNAIADVIFGEYNPSGKLPVSFPYVTGQEPLHYDRKSTGRMVPENDQYDMVFWSHYEDAPNEALYPFGFGLSYTSFEFNNLEVIASENPGKITVSVGLKNTGDLEGTETIQVYIRDIAASITQPIKKLVDFKQIRLLSGQEDRISFTLDSSDFGFYNPQYQYIVEDGKFEIMVGNHSNNLISQTVEVKF